MDVSMDTMHLQDPLALFGFEGSALSLPRFLLSHALSLFFNNGKGPLYEKSLNGTEWWPTVQTSNSCTSRPDVCQCLVV